MGNVVETPQKENRENGMANEKIRWHYSETCHLDPLKCSHYAKTNSSVKGWLPIATEPDGQVHRVHLFHFPENTLSEWSLRRGGQSASWSLESSMLQRRWKLKMTLLNSHVCVLESCQGSRRENTPSFVIYFYTNHLDTQLCRCWCVLDNQRQHRRILLMSKNHIPIL